MKYDLFKNIAITDIPNQSDWDLKTFLLWSLYISFNQNINMLTAFFERFLKKRPTRPTGLAWHGGGGMYHWNFRDNWMRVVHTSRQLATDLHGKLEFWYTPFFKYFLTQQQPAVYLPSCVHTPFGTDNIRSLVHLPDTQGEHITFVHVFRTTIRCSHTSRINNI